MKTIRSILEELMLNHMTKPGKECVDQALSEIEEIIQQKVIESQQSLISEYQRVLSVKQDGSQISLYEFGQIINMDKKRMWHELAQINHNKKGDK